MQPNDYFGDFDDLFERMTQDRRGVFGRRGQATGASAGVGDADFAVDVARHDDEIVVTADVPGFETDDFDVAVEGDLLTVRAEAESESEMDADADEDAYVRRERHHRAMRRTIRLPADVDEDGATATYRNGVLTVSLPIEAGDDVRHIHVE